ncbi:MAG: AarF/ABC1/UbiB kinase family protein [Coriobacteriia bacterium]|nr:AarF/ABC1/UbiB kinase family protein [Coriobacteriia bacterium]
MGRISEESRERFVDLVWAAVNKDPRLATDTLIAVSGNPNVDEEELHQEVDRLIGKYHGVELGRIAFGELMTQTLGLIRGYRLGVPSDFALLLGTLVVLEGVGTMLDPSFDFTENAKPFVDRIVAERLRPSAVFSRAASSWRHSVRILDQLPDTADRVLRRLAQGEATITIRPTGYREILDDLHELVNRLAFALVVAALVIGFSTLLVGQTAVPGWARTVGEIGLLLAVAVTIWFFGSIILAHQRSRRRKR